jgi:hypothetical protein
LEAQFRHEWRKDLPGKKTKATIWSNRSQVYGLVELYMSRFFHILSSEATPPLTEGDFETRSLTEEEALLEANKTYACCINAKGKPNVREKVIPEFRMQRIYEESCKSVPRYVDPYDGGPRFVPPGM